MAFQASRGDGDGKVTGNVRRSFLAARVAPSYPSRMPPLPRPAELYEPDFYAWTQLQARELRRLVATRPSSALDLPHLAEEIADLGKEQRNSLRSWVTRVVEHLLVLEHSPATNSRRGRIG